MTKKPRTPLDALGRLVALIDEPAFPESIKSKFHLEVLRESGEMEDARETLKRWVETP